MNLAKCKSFGSQVLGGIKARLCPRKTEYRYLGNRDLGGRFRKMN